MGPSLLYAEFIEFPQWTGNSRPPGNPTVPTCPLNLGYFGLKTPGIFRDLLGDHFARVESSRDQHLTMFILHFHVFVAFLTTQKSHENPRFCRTLQNLVPCPDDRAQNSVQDSIDESSVRPNPTLVFAKILFNFCHF